MQHDENYKRLFAFRLMVEHLLRACLPDARLAAADFSTLRKLSAEYISDELLKRHGDTAERLAPAGAAVPPARTLEDAKMTLVERVGEWPKQWLREGREQGFAQGRKQGREQGVEQQRALLLPDGGGALRRVYRRPPGHHIGADRQPGTSGRGG